MQRLTFEVAMNAAALPYRFLRALPLLLILFVALPCPPCGADMDQLSSKQQGYLVVAAPDNGPAARDTPPSGLTLKRFEAILVNEIYQDAVESKRWLNNGQYWTLELTLIPGKSQQSLLTVDFAIDDGAKRCRLSRVSDKGQVLPMRELLGLYDLIMSELTTPSGR
jgi:hypothetical protein